MVAKIPLRGDRLKYNNKIQAFLGDPDPRMASLKKSVLLAPWHLPGM